MRVSHYISIFSLSNLALVSATSGDLIKEHHIPFHLNGSKFTYPWPVKLYEFKTQHAQTFEMAFMDLAPIGIPNNKTALLMHGRNFCGPTWNATALILSQAGYRVILPDQIGFCKSSKPDRYQFSLLGLMEILGIEKVTLIGHSMGGMLATRFSLMFPTNVTELVLVNPIGLEDWKALGIPWQDLDTTYASERVSNYASIRAYEQATYYVGTWSPAYDIWSTCLPASTKVPKPLNMHGTKHWLWIWFCRSRWFMSFHC